MKALRKITALLLFFVFPMLCNSQQIKLSGQVSIHNSKYETGHIIYVDNAVMSADFTKDAITDNEGKFTLEFVEIPDGTAVKVKAEKSGLEVVNERDLLEVILNRNRNVPLRIYLAENGKINEAKLQLLNVSRDALFAERDAEIRRLRGNEKESKAAIAQLESRLNLEIKDRFEAETLLNAYTDELKIKLPQYLLDLATINLDFASELYKEAYEYFKNGKLEQVIETLDEEKLRKSLDDAKLDIKKGEQLIEIGNQTKEKGLLLMEQTIEGFGLRGRTLSLQFKYEEAAKQYDIIINIYKDSIVDIDNTKLPQWYEKASTNYFFAGMYQRTLEYQLKEMKIIKTLDRSKDSLLAQSYTNISATYRELGDYNSALEYQKKGIQLLEKEYGEDNKNLAIPYYAIAGTYGYLGNDEETNKYYEKALRIFLKDPKFDEDNLAVLYGNRAVHFVNIGAYDKALENDLKGLEILKRIRKPNDPLLISAYGNLGATYYTKGNYEKALEYQLKSIADFEKIYKPDHPELLTAYNNIGSTYSSMGNYKKALEYQVKATKGREKIYPPQHPSLFTSYRNLANTYYELKDYEAATKYYLKALNITDKPYTNLKDEMLYEIYSNLSEMYQLKEDYSHALIYEKKIIHYSEKTLSANDINLAACYENITVVYVFLSQFSEALYYQEKAVRILRRLKDENDEYLIRAVELLNLLKEKVKKVKK
ncbi:tetratricopeptide repeat protein [Aequorivita capsosiphonis]|uniref:tetratricopeptide repeat protein n=1 Tax=Aequorivita capsosiphonis TaxID=487317 RepID=UPI000414B572|nr:tetratricopeptide repeat protein [Aequorivita capsosiphonis]